MINIYGLKKQIENQGVLTIDNIHFQKGKIYSLVGHNGSGKSTLIKILYNIEDFQSGSITINDEYIDNECMNNKNIYKYLSYTPQESRFLSGSLMDNFNYIYEYGKDKFIKDKSYLYKLIDEFDLNKKLNTNTKNLSGGEIAKAQFIRSLIMNKEYNLLDEPMANMDLKTIKKAEKEILKLKEEGKTVILVTHDFIQAKKISDYIVFMENLKHIDTYESDVFFNGVMKF
ncbi:ATP-binding cassette domain-containing protein [Romboutsia sp. 1001713B170131_170501_G6]|uniref:ATP-binding cassette domain-containing protein n=1 Tax=Romboutsia sp. 1001713B170131_170501_G6 TaxID=2787108 RepID=UPI0018AB225E|nr:ATP-binding cassette domain-containing protein [Romboutsia sp. 1001713B170131_170501_G6]